MQTIRYVDRNTEQCWSCKKRIGEGFTGVTHEAHVDLELGSELRKMRTDYTLFEVAPECRMTGKLMLNVYDEKCRYYEKEEL